MFFLDKAIIYLDPSEKKTESQQRISLKKKNTDKDKDISPCSRPSLYGKVSCLGEVLFW